jgi:hypothetical protein
MPKIARSEVNPNPERRLSSFLNLRKSKEGDPAAEVKFPEPSDLARQLVLEGWPVPGFLLFPGDPRHVRPLVALSVLGRMLEASGCEVEPYVYFPPEDPRHVPAHIAALQRQRQLWELQNLHPRPKSQTWARFRSRFAKFWTPFQYLIGTIISLCSIAITFHGIHEGWIEAKLPPAAAGIIFVFLLIVIAYSEGYHVTIITLEKADSEVFRVTYPTAYKTHKIANANAECFLVGRQVFLTFIVFIVAEVTKFKHADHRPDWLFFPGDMIVSVTSTGVCTSLIVLAFGQLLPQLIATSYPLYHMNLPGGIILVYLMLFLDKIGISNISFWGAYAWRRIRGIMVNEEFGVGGEVVFGVDGKDGTAKAVASNPNNDEMGATEAGVKTASGPATTEEANAGAKIGGHASGEIHVRVRKDPLEILKAIFSGGILFGATGVLIYNIINGQSLLVAHWGALLVIHGVLLIGMLYLEGMNLCVLALEKVPNEQIALINPGAVASHKLVNDADSVKRFLLGRQFCVVWMDFLISQIGGLWSLPITVFVSQVMSQIIAATNPTYWMALPGARLMLLIALSVERLGVCHFGWFLGHWFQWMGEVAGILKPEPYSVGNKVAIRGSATAGQEAADAAQIAQLQETAI